MSNHHHLQQHHLDPLHHDVQGQNQHNAVANITIILRVCLSHKSELYSDHVTVLAKKHKKRSHSTNPIVKRGEEEGLRVRSRLSGFNSPPPHSFSKNISSKTPDNCSRLLNVETMRVFSFMGAFHFFLEVVHSINGPALLTQCHHNTY